MYHGRLPSKGTEGMKINHNTTKSERRKVRETIASLRDKMRYAMSKVTQMNLSPASRQKAKNNITELQLRLRRLEHILEGYLEAKDRKRDPALYGPALESITLLAGLPESLSWPRGMPWRKRLRNMHRSPWEVAREGQKERSCPVWSCLGEHHAARWHARETYPDTGGCRGGRG